MHTEFGTVREEAREGTETQCKSKGKRKGGSTEGQAKSEGKAREGTGKAREIKGKLGKSRESKGKEG